MEPVKVVIRYANGRLIKGYTNDFFPNKPMFHVRPIESQPTEKGVEVYLKELKAIFFVKDFMGNPAYKEKKHFAANEQTSGRKVQVTFTDSEVLVGTTLGFDPNRLGYFVIPTDPDSNNLRVFVVAAAVKKFSFLQ
jgi:hypothetical protein